MNQVTEERPGVTSAYSAYMRAGAFALLCLAIGVLYAPVLAGMARKWWIDKNSSHGFLVPVIVAALVWQRRQAAMSRRRAWTPGLGVLGFGLLLYPLGLVSGVEFVPAVSFVTVLGGLMLCLLGPQASRELAFPYAFMWFMVPWPDTLVEFVSFPMQLFSARFATMVVGLVGVPVSCDGVDIHLRNYTFSVGVPCSGMRSLVALLALSAVTAYLMSGPRWKRGALFLAGLPLAVLANVARIACILLIATFWGAEVAEGFFHGFSGVVVFLFATLGLMATGRALGLRFAALPHAGEAALIEQPSTAAHPLPVARALFAPFALIGVTAFLVVAWHVTDRPRPVAEVDLSAVPMQIGGWHAKDLGPLDRVSADMLQPDAFMDRVYVRSGYPIDVTVVYGHAKNTFHSPGFCLLGGGWNITSKSKRSLDAGGGAKVLANEFALQRQDDRRVVFYWFASYGEATPSWVTFQYRLLRNRLLSRSTSGALVRITVPVGESEDAASGAAVELIHGLYPRLRSALAL
jgi:exosortase D (VPLPA-CTERM-specific)